jgi:hypothetical protein
MVPELASVDGLHGQPPEHVTLAVGDTDLAGATLYFPAGHASQKPPLGPA